ncbi:MAG: flagellar basal body P-ring protein FlgI [Paraglaciecola sp.]
MNKYIPKSILILAPLLLSSCSATQPLEPIPALLVQPTEDNRIVLEHAIGDLFNSQPIKLANGVFTQQSKVVIERRLAKDSRGNLLDGREIREADSISLLTEDGQCYIRHDQTGNIKLVRSINCLATQN